MLRLTVRISLVKELLDRSRYLRVYSMHRPQYVIYSTRVIIVTKA